MTEILEGIRLIDGIGTESTPINAYLVGDEREYALIDTGVPSSPKSISKYLETNHIAPSKIRHIVLTHEHPDHIGGAKEISQLATNAKLYAHWIEAAYIAKKPKYEGPPQPRPYIIDPIEVDVRFKDGDVLQILDGLEIIHTPGHTPGHICLYSKGRRAVFTGDLVLNNDRNLTPPPARTTLDMATELISIKKISGLGAESLLTVHGPPVVRDPTASSRLGVVSGL